MRAKPIVLKYITPEHQNLAQVIKPAVGGSTDEKIQQAVRSYTLKNHYLIGAFDKKQLVGVVGFKKLKSNVVIRHISVLAEYRNKGIGKALLECVSQDIKPQKIGAETDADSVDFYQKLGFRCQQFQGKYGIRYNCKLMAEKR
jgi:N-acetylglutamate synthase-like GNAT family acetyltransferase